MSPRSPRLLSSRFLTWPLISAGEMVTLCAGLAGGLIFTALHVPGGPMPGAVVAVALLSLTGRAHGLGGLLRMLGLGTVGVAVGSVIGPDTFAHMAAYPLSIALMALCVLTMTAMASLVWTKLMGWPTSSALLASTPGSMSYIVAVSLTMGTDAARIAVVQMSRVIFLVTLLPMIIVWQSGVTPAQLAAAAAGAVYDPLWIVLVVMALGLLAGWVLQSMGMAGGFILGGLFVSGLAHFSGFAPGRAPDWVMNAGQIIVGAWVGSRFADFDWRLFGRILVGTLLGVGATMLVSVGFAALASWLFKVPFGAALIGYAPGGPEAMVVLSLALGVDPVFVTAHHFARYFLINATLPFVVARMTRREDAAGKARREDG